MTSKERSAAWYQANKERVKANARRTNPALTQRTRAALDAIRRSRGCIDCGYNADTRALEFDHVRGEKVMAVSSYRSLPAALREAEKCEIRCANCHAIRTHGGIIQVTAAAAQEWRMKNSAALLAGFI